MNIELVKKLPVLKTFRLLNNNDTFTMASELKDGKVDPKCVWIKTSHGCLCLSNGQWGESGPDVSVIELKVKLIVEQL